MSTAKYSFLPWLRQGLTNGIANKDNFNPALDPNEVIGAVPAERVSFSVDVKFKASPLSGGETDKDKSKTVKLYGPYDILGISKEAIVKTEPKNWITNFEPNYLPFIEFYEEDFLWRYTPAAPFGTVERNQKLRPWLTLVVLKEGEFERMPFNGINPSFKTRELANLIFPDEKQMYAWAHVHVNGELTGANVPAAVSNLKDILETDPNRGICRLICPRRLEENMGYYAFVIPTFELGRLAGLGLSIPTTNAPNALTPSWSWTNTDPVTGIDIEYPIYYEWFFKTGSVGSFDYLVELLEPTSITTEIAGKRSMDVQNPGLLNLKGISSVKEIDLYGAIKPVEDPVPADEWPVPDNPLSPNPFFEVFRGILNSPYQSQQASSTDDPEIAPPIYGRWHAKVDQLLNNSDNWVHKVNLDPSYRVFAGVGAQVVKKRQEEFMHLAWQQVDEVEAANRLLRQMQLAREASTSTYNRTFTTAEPTDLVSFTNTVHARIKVNTNDTVYAETRESIVPEGCFTGAFRRITRPGGFVSANVGNGVQAITTASVISSLNSGTSTVAAPYSAPAGMTAYTILAPSMITASFTLSQPPRPNFVLTIPGGNFYSPGSGGVNSVAANSFITTVPNLHTALSAPATQPYTGPSLVFANLKTTINTGLEPGNNLLNIANKVISLTNGTGQAVTLTALDMVMAAPKIEYAMYKDLYDISPDLLMPNLNDLPQNSICLLEPNQKVIEAYMLGLNHEMAGELLWREYPTDQRGTVFMKFWESYYTTNTNTNPTEYDKTRSIKPVHLWKTPQNALSKLGENLPAGYASNLLLLTVRGELLKKYPNTLVYANKAEWDNNDATKARKLAPYNVTNGNTKLPLFMARVSDIVFIGFDLSATDAKGTDIIPGQQPDMNQPGWFFVFEEIGGEVHFGLDEFDEDNPIISPITNILNWDILNWGHMGDTVESIKFIDTDRGITVNAINSNSVVWGSNSADMAYALYRSPAMLAIHAKEML